MSIINEINNQNFENEVLKSETLTVVDFWATWCGPCRKLIPVLEEIASEYDGKVKFVKINTDENIEIAKQYSVSGLPTLLIFKNGEPKDRLVGLMPKSSIVSNIQKNL